MGQVYAMTLRSSRECSGEWSPSTNLFGQELEPYCNDMQCPPWTHYIVHPLLFPVLCARYPLLCLAGHGLEHAHCKHYLSPLPPLSFSPSPPFSQHELKAGVESTFYIQQLLRHLSPVLKEAKVKSKLLSHLSPLRKVLTDLEVDLRSTADDA